MKCSVCMAAYNGEKYIKEQIDSILRQIGDEDELIISDDGSEDSTVKIIESIDDDRIILLHNTIRHGYTSNFENALNHASGDLILLSDQDDVWLPQKYETVKGLLAEYDFVVHDCKIIDQDLKILKESYFEEMNVKPGFLSQMIRMRYLGCCMAFGRSVLEMALPFPPNTDLVEHDTWLASISELYFNCKKYDEPLLLYRRHGSNTSDGGWGKGYSLYNKVYRRIYRLTYLLQAKRNVITKNRGI